MSRFLISCGGTGGHLSPGIALAEGLIARGHAVTLLISEKKVDARLVEKYPHLNFVRIAGLPFSWSPAGFVRCAASQFRGFLTCRRLARGARPDGIVGFGGFTSAPAVFAGWFMGIPVALHEANRVPGMAVRMLGRLARRVYLPQGIELPSVAASVIRHAALPVRSEISRFPQAASRTALGLEPDRRVLAILGGSQGASPLNAWARANIEALAAEGIQMFCVTGPGKGGEEILEFPSRNGSRIRAIFTPFCDRVGELLSAADLVVSRAGAGTIAELVRCHTPAILVPYPFAADNHQKANASHFERQGGGLVVSEDALASLRSEVLGTLFNEWLLHRFCSNLERMDSASAPEALLRDIEDVASAPPSDREPVAATA